MRNSEIKNFMYLNIWINSASTLNEKLSKSGIKITMDCLFSFCFVWSECQAQSVDILYCEACKLTFEDGSSMILVLVISSSLSSLFKLKETN